MGQASSHRPLNYEGRIQFQVIPCGICGGKSGSGTGFYSEYFGIPCQYHFTNASYSFFRRRYKTLAVLQIGRSLVQSQLASVDLSLT